MYIFLNFPELKHKCKEEMQWLFGPSFPALGLTSSNQGLESHSQACYITLTFTSVMPLLWLWHDKQNGRLIQIMATYFESSVAHNSWFVIGWHGYVLVKHFWLKSSILSHDAPYMFSYCNVIFPVLMKTKTTLSISLH